MAGRILRRATALGVAAAAAGSLHAVATWELPDPHPHFFDNVKGLRVLLESAPGLQAALLRSRPLSGAHLRHVRAQAEKDLARADADGAKGDPAAAADLRLLLALLAARDGRTEEALQLYAEAARNAPFDPRPRALAFFLCLWAGRVRETLEWRTSYHRLVPAKEKVPPGYESDEIKGLMNELFIAATLGGVYDLKKPEERELLMCIASGEVDAGLVVALQDRTLSTAERLQLRALRVYLHAKVRLLLKEEDKLMK